MNLQPECEYAPTGQPNTYRCPHCEHTITVDLPPHLIHRPCPRRPEGPVVESIPKGAGTELKRLLKRFGIVPKGDCNCSQHADEMDARGVDWCLANLEQIVTWLEEESHVRGLPFIRLAGRILVRRAIRNARQTQKEMPCPPLTNQ